MKKIETHLHTGNTSYCAMVAPSAIPQIYKQCGYSGIVVTDHYMEYVLDRFGELNYKKKIDNFLQGYRIAKQEGDKIGLEVWLGCEIHLQQYSVEHMPSCEVLVYGQRLEEVLYSTPYLNRLSSIELYQICCENDLLMFQAHPFREYCIRIEPEFLHGVEVYNANPRHESNNGLAKSFAREHGLLTISGGDFHKQGDENRGGLILPDDVKNIGDMVKAIKEGKAELYIGD